MFFVNWVQFKGYLRLSLVLHFARSKVAEPGHLFSV